MLHFFDDRMIDDVVRCITASDMIAEAAKPLLIEAMWALRKDACATLPSCRDCASLDACEALIGDLLNGGKCIG